MAAKRETMAALDELALRAKVNIQNCPPDTICPLDGECGECWITYCREHPDELEDKS